MKPILILFVLAFSICSSSEIIISSIQGASYYERRDQEGWFIYGGLAGDDSTCSEKNGEASELCNSCKVCSENTNCNCNEKRIYPRLALKIQFSSDSHSGDVLVRNETDQTSIPGLDRYPRSVKARSLTQAILYWETICSNLGSSISCNNILPSNQVGSSLILGIDGNQDGDLSDQEDDHINLEFRVYTPQLTEVPANCDQEASMRGICSMQITKGDQKAVIKSITTHPLYPSIEEDLEIDKIRIMFSTTSFPETPHQNYADLDVDSVKNIKEAIIKDFENGQRYYFRFAVVDKAGNVSFFQSRKLFEAQCPTLDTDCDYSLVPEEVLGFLKKDQNCFIAQAVLGSSLHHHLKTFREFRNKILLKHFLGKKLVLIYYKWGPHLTHVLKTHPSVKLLFQGILWVLWLTAWLILHPFVLFFILFLTSSFIFFRRLSFLFLFLVLFFHLSTEASLLKNKIYSFQVGFYTLDSLKNEASEAFNSFYKNKPIVFMLDYEIPLKKRPMQIGFKLGSGLSYSLGTGKFGDGSEATENFYFFLIPNRISLISRIHLPQSLLVPFVEGGAGYSVILEKRSDGLNTSFLGKKAGARTLHWALGVALNLAYDKPTKQELYQDYGIKLVYLYLEYRQIISLKKELNVGSQLLNLGLSFQI